MKKIMILGAGIYQVPLIKAAKKMGLYTIVSSIKGNYPGFEWADKVYYEDTTDYEKIVKIAGEEKIDGILTAGTDVAVITVGKVCDKLKLTGISGKAAEIASNKMLMKEAYEKYGVRTARFRKVSLDLQKVKECVSDLRYPLMFKAVDTSGSRGIIKVNSAVDIQGAYDSVKQVTKKDYFIIEEFLDGIEFGAQAFVHNNKIEFILPHGDYIFKGDAGVPVGHFAPYEISADICEDTKKQLQLAVKAMGLNNCAINADFILVDNKCYVLEIGGRSGATCLAELTSIYYDFDYYEKMILVALGEEVSFYSEKAIPNASKLLISNRSGVIKSICNSNIGNDNIVDIQFDYQVGDTVRKFQVGPDRVGHVITKGKTLNEAVEILDKVIEQIKIVVE